jgi:NtrC-family two-component system sensor histidine kinase KinB
VIEVDLARLLAHELEPSLVSIHLRLSSLAGGSDACREEAESCLAELEAIRSLLRELLLLSNRELTPRAFPLAPVFERLARRFRPIAAARGIALEIPATPAEVEGDPGATERALASLLDNAVKFSPERSRIEVEARERGAAIEISVEDQGMGIALSDQERVFEPFVQLDREKPGAGLGLSIAKNLAEAQGGRLILASEPGGGSTFVLSLKKA